MNSGSDRVGADDGLGMDDSTGVDHLSRVPVQAMFWL